MINVFAVGRLTKDPETKETSGGMIAKFSVACDNDDRDKTTTFLNCTVFGKQAEFVAKYLTKGRLVEIVGALKSNKGNDGNTYWGADISKVKGLDKPKDSAPSTDTYEPFADEEYA